MKVLTHLNLNKNEIQNAVIQNLAIAPSTPFQGQVYYDTVEKILKIFDGTSWTSAGSSYTLPTATSSIKGGIRLGSGLQAGVGADADLISVTSQTEENFTTVLKTKLDGIEEGAEVNVQADWNQTNNTLDDYIKNKPSLAAVATSGSYADLSGTPDLTLKADLVDGKIPTSQLPSYVDDVIELISIQSTPPTGVTGNQYFNTTDNKIYTYGASAWENPVSPEQGKIYINLLENYSYRWPGSAMVSISNPIDIATQLEAETGIDNTKVMTPLRTAQHWAKHKYTATIGDGTNTSYVITHNLGTKNVSVTLQESASPYEIVYTTIEATTDNTLTAKFAVAPASGAYIVSIIG